AVALRIGLGFFLRLEGEPDLLGHVGAARIAHERIDAARHFRLEHQKPALGLALAGLHGIAGGAIDAGFHARSSTRCEWSEYKDSIFGPPVPNTGALPG